MSACVGYGEHKGCCGNETKDGSVLFCSHCDELNKKDKEQKRQEKLLKNGNDERNTYEDGQRLILLEFCRRVAEGYTAERIMKLMLEKYKHLETEDDYARKIDENNRG